MIRKTLLWFAFAATLVLSVGGCANREANYWSGVAGAVKQQQTVAPRVHPAEPVRLCYAAGEVMQWPCKYVHSERRA